MGVKYIFDIPVYRVSSDRYYQERDQYIENVLFPKDSPSSEKLRALDKAQPNQNSGIRDHLQRTYGGCWKFNEIIGYIRLHFLGSQVRGEYFGVNKKRIIRTRTKTLEYMTWKLTPEVEISLPPTQAGILGAIRDYIQDCKKELPKRYINDSMFEAIAENVNWVALFKQ